MVMRLERQPAQSALFSPADPTCLGASPLAGTRFLASFAEGRSQDALKASHLPSRTIEAGSDLSREGDVSAQLYILISGWAVRYKTTSDGSRQIIGFVLPGELANLDAFLFRDPGFGVRVLTTAHVVSVPCETALDLAQSSLEIAAGFAQLAVCENAILSQWALCLGRMTALQRLAHLFCELAVRLSVDTRSGSVMFEAPVTQDIVADTLGLTAVHVNRTFKQLRAAGLLEMNRRQIRIPDIARLRRFADFDETYLHRHNDGMREKFPLTAGRQGVETCETR